MGIHLMNDFFSNVTLSQPFSITYLSYQFWRDVGDPRVDKYLIARAGPLLTLSIIGVYLYFSIYLGPKLMAKREPFKLRRLIFFYNVIMVILNFKYLYFVIGFLDYGIGLFIINSTKRDDYSTKAFYDIEMGHQLFMTKFIDLFDTVFFVLRKKQRHVSVLHLYHHSSVPILYWIAFRLLPTFPPLCIFVLINCTIHVLMYTYYALSSFGPKLRPYLWWKKYITQIQMIQFVIYGVYATYISLVVEGIPYYLQILVHTQSPIFLILFGRFYIMAYMENKNKCVDKNGNNGYHKPIDSVVNTNGVINGIINDQNNNDLISNEKPKDKYQ